MVELRVDRGDPVVADEAPRGAVVRGREFEVARALARRAAAEVGRRVRRVDVQRGAAPGRDGRGDRAARAVVGRAEQAPGQDKRAKFPTSKAPFSVVFRSFRLIFGRAIISRNGLEA